MALVMASLLAWIVTGLDLGERFRRADENFEPRRRWPRLDGEMDKLTPGGFLGATRLIASLKETTDVSYVTRQLME